MARNPSNEPNIPPEPEGHGRDPATRKRERLYVDGHKIDADVVLHNFASRKGVRPRVPKGTNWEDYGTFKCNLNGTSWVMVDDLVYLWDVARTSVVRCLLNPIASAYLKAKREGKDSFTVEYTWEMDRCEETRGR